MNKPFLCVVSLVAAWSGSGFAPAKAPPPADSTVKVELTVAAEHVSKDLKAGAKVDLERVTAKIGSGRSTDYPTTTIFRDLEVASVTTVEKPGDVGAAVTVELKVTGDQANRIKELKTEQAPYEERVAGKPATVVTKMAVLRLAEMTKSEVAVAAENVPDGVKAGSKVQLVYVASRTVTGTGRVAEQRSPVVAGSFEVLSVEKVEKPTDADHAVKVALRISKTQAERIETFKTREVTVVERAGGRAVMKKKTIPMVLELAKEEEKGKMKK
jgi:hypothetical protein